MFRTFENTFRISHMTLNNIADYKYFGISQQSKSVFLFGTNFYVALRTCSL